MKTLLLVFALSMFASRAFARFMGTGGFAPYSFNAPAAAAGGGGMVAWNGDAIGANCRTEIQGRSGRVSHCDPQSPATPNKIK
jgi:hypothetical protein